MPRGIDLQCLFNRANTGHYDHRLNRVLANANRILHELNHFKDEAFLQEVTQANFLIITADNVGQAARRVLQPGVAVAEAIRASNGVFTYSLSRGRSRIRDLGSHRTAFTDEKNHIHVNRGHFNLSSSDEELINEKVETLMHEYMHVLGYQHPSNADASDDEVPNKVGQLFVRYLERIGVSFLPQP